MTSTRRRSARACALGVLALFAAGSPLRAQERAARAITAKPVEFAEPFSSLTRMIELADGRVLINDNTEKKLGVADFASGEFTEVARMGAGPLEYRVVFNLLRLPGDSILLWDMGNQRTLLMAPDGKPVRTIAIGGSGNMMAMMGQPIPRESDASGRLYAQFIGMDVSGGQIRRADSTALVRMVGVGGKRDTLRLTGVDPGTEPVSSTSGGTTKLRTPGFPPRNAWGVFPDGRVMLIDGEHYTPEIILPDGTRRPAAAIPFPSIPVTAQDREAHMKAHREQIGRLRITPPPGRTAPLFEAAEPEKWQTHMPPVLNESVRVDSRSRAWVRVIDRDLEAGERYDLLDADGKLVDAVRLPKGTKFVAMGKGVFYATREDEDGLIYLQRYELP